MTRARDLMFDNLKQQVDLLENALRQTGRTTRTLCDLRNGDIFVVHNNDAQHWAKNLIYDKQLKDCIVIVAKSFSDVEKRTVGLRNRRILFDNAAEYLILKNEIDNLKKRLEFYEEPPKFDDKEALEFWHRIFDD